MKRIAITECYRCRMERCGEHATACPRCGASGNVQFTRWCVAPMKPTWYRLIRRFAGNEIYLVTDRRQLEVVRARAASLTRRNAMLVRLEIHKLASGAWGWEWIVEGKAVLACGRTWVSEADAETQARGQDLRSLVSWPVEESEVVR